MWRVVTILFLLGALAAAGPGSASSQVSRADSAAVLLSAATGFEEDGREDVARALLHYITERFGDTPAGSAARGILDEGRWGGSETGSRVELQVWSTLYGLWLGVAVPAALGADGTEPYGVGLLVGGPGGFFAGRRLANARTLSEGQVRAITFGGTWGTWQGFGLTEILDWGETTECTSFGCYETGSNAQELFGGMVLGGLTGIATGAVLARRPISPGLATTVNFGALWGTWFGVATGVLLDLEGDDHLAATLVGGDAGLLTTALLGPGWDLSRSRARLISIAGVIGGLAGAGLDLLLMPDDEKVAMGIPLTTSILGLGVGAMATGEDEGGPGSSGGTADPSAPPDIADHSLPEGALVSLARGRLGLAVPAPFPTLLPLDRPDGPAWEPGIGLTLFRARFR